MLRLGYEAMIGELMHSAHGGAVEAVLDEVTAEHMKIKHSPNTVTRSMKVRPRKASNSGTPRSCGTRPLPVCAVFGGGPKTLQPGHQLL